MKKSDEHEELYVTPWHPMMSESGSFFFPGDRGGESKTPTEKTINTKFIYSFLLKNRSPTMVFNGFYGITLAHGIQNNSVAAHDFWGTEKVVKNLQEIDVRGFSRGLVSINQGSCLRQNNRVVKITKKDRPVVLTMKTGGAMTLPSQ